MVAAFLDATHLFDFVCKLHGIRIDDGWFHIDELDGACGGVCYFFAFRMTSRISSISLTEMSSFRETNDTIRASEP